MKRSSTSTLALLLAAGSLFAQGKPRLQVQPENPEFKAWQQRQAEAKALGLSGVAGTRTKDGYRLGYAPSPHEMPVSGPDGDQGRLARLRAVAFPAAFDLRNVSGQNYVTGVRNQNPFGTCWAHGALASLESTQLMSGRGTFDFSEWHLAWFAYNDLDSTFVSFTKPTVDPGLDTTFDIGGNYYRSCAMLLRGTGAVSEADRPYQNTTNYAPSSLPTGTEANQIWVKESLVLDNTDLPTRTANIKAALQADGAVAMSLYWADSDYSNTNKTYRNRSTSTNHIVTIVGWDDNFAATNFPSTNRPSANGAWIVKNSWGPSWGASGYFYLSYDSAFKAPHVYVGQTKAPSRIYQYDPLGCVESYGLGSRTIYMANVHTAVEAGSLEAVNFWAPVVNCAYEVSVRTGVTGDPTTGTLALGPQAGTLDLPGYRQVALGSPVNLAAGQKFAVIVKLTTPNYDYPLAVEDPYTGYSDKATAAAGQGYYSTDGTTWTDLVDPDPNKGIANASLCIKAVTFAPSLFATVSPSTLTTLVSDVPTFKATTSGFTTDSSVDWSISGSGGAFSPTRTLGDGIAATTLTPSGATGTFTITATPVETGTPGTATLTLVDPANVIVDLFPGTFTTLANAPVNFLASAQPLTNSAVTWSCSGGTLSNQTGSSATWTGAAGGTFTITATSVQATGRSAQATVTVIDPSEITISVDNPTASLIYGTGTGTTVSLTGTCSYGDISWATTAGTLSSTSTVSYTANTLTAPATDPLNTATATVTLTSATNNAKTATSTVTIRTRNINGDTVLDLRDVLAMAADWDTTQSRSRLSGGATVGQADLDLLLAGLQ